MPSIDNPSTSNESENLYNVSMASTQPDAQPSSVSFVEEVLTSTPQQPRSTSSSGINSLKKRAIKRKPNASVKAAKLLGETAKARKTCIEKESLQTMQLQKEKHDLEMQVLMAKLEYYERMNQKLEKENS